MTSVVGDSADCGVVGDAAGGGDAPAEDDSGGRGQTGRSQRGGGCVRSGAAGVRRPPSPRQSPRPLPRRRHHHHRRLLPRHLRRRHRLQRKKKKDAIFRTVQHTRSTSTPVHPYITAPLYKDRSWQSDPPLLSTHS